MYRKLFIYVFCVCVFPTGFFLSLMYIINIKFKKKNAKWKVVPARNGGWTKRIPVTYMNHNLPGGV